MKIKLYYGVVFNTCIPQTPNDQVKKRPHTEASFPLDINHKQFAKH